MSKPKEKPPAATEGSNNNITCPQGSDAAAASQPRNMSIEQQAESPLSSVHVWPAHLAPPEGLVGDLVEYFLDSARYPMEEGAVMAALALMAGIAGRCFNFDGTGLNLYLLVLAESGRGKEDMRGSIDRMLSSVRQQVPMVDDCIGPDTFASGQGLIRTLGRQPCFVSVQSEFGLRLKELTDQRAPSSTVILRRLLLELYGKGAGTVCSAAPRIATPKRTPLLWSRLHSPSSANQRLATYIATCHSATLRMACCLGVWCLSALVIGRAPIQMLQPCRQNNSRRSSPLSWP
jgi:hypothetical protein